MQCVRVLCVNHRCVPILQNICSAVASCSAPGKSFHFIRKYVFYLKREKSLLTLNLTRCLCSSVRKCWSCGSSVHLFFCSSCNTIQPPQHKATYFQILNCEQRFDLDTQKLQEKYIELQRSLHPDNFSQKSQNETFISMLGGSVLFHEAAMLHRYSNLQKSLEERHFQDRFGARDEPQTSSSQSKNQKREPTISRSLHHYPNRDTCERRRKIQLSMCESREQLCALNEQNTEQSYSVGQSALVNKAYRTLQKPLTRSVYLLQLHGIELKEGTDPAADPELLLKVMEVNEKLAEMQSLDEVNAVGMEVQVTLKNLTEQMNASLNKGDLQSAREILVQMKYFANLEEKVKEKLRENL